MDAKRHWLFKTPQTGVQMASGIMEHAADQLPDSHVAKKTVLDYIKRFEVQYGPGTVTAFGSYAWDAGLLMQPAIVQTSKSGKPGTPKFRKALRDVLEKVTGMPVTNAIATMTPEDHLGLDQRSRVMVQMVGRKWVLER